MALTTTTLVGAITNVQTSIVVASATGFAAGNGVVIDQEEMTVQNSYVSGTTIPVIRGVGGTAAVAHVNTSNVTTYLPSDQPVLAPQQITTYQVSGRPVVISSIIGPTTATLSLPPVGSDARVILNGTSVITLTIPVPTKDMDGTQLVILSNGVAAHVLTVTGGFGGVGSGYTALTAAAAARGINIIAYAVNGAWNIISAPAWTGTVTKVTAAVA